MSLTMDEILRITEIIVAGVAPIISFIVAYRLLMMERRLSGLAEIVNEFNLLREELEQNLTRIGKSESASMESWKHLSTRWWFGSRYMFDTIRPHIQDDPASLFNQVGVLYRDFNEYNDLINLRQISNLTNFTQEKNLEGRASEACQLMDDFLKRLRKSVV